jgi:cob(I)alamin adenosyltransferase
LYDVLYGSLIKEFKREMGSDKGTVQVYTGNGKGKTTASLGAALRAIGHGWNVVMIQFMKGRPYGEIISSSKLDGFIIEQYGRDEFVNPEKPEQVDVDLAKGGWERAEELLKEEKLDMLILDEINVAVSFGLISVEEVVKFIENKPERLELILTGRYADKRVMELADTVTEMNEIKHHYQKGIKARKGIEF